MARKSLNVQLLVIDPQVDFMDLPGSALPVPGANVDMGRLAKMVERVGQKLSDIHVTLDSHKVIDIAHPGLWVGKDGKHPNPFTVISNDDIRREIWRPRMESAKPGELGGKSILEYVLHYTAELARKGNYPLMIWPEHCIIGSPGHAMQSDFASALYAWERKLFANANIITKGTCVWTEAYGGLEAEVPLATDPSTSLNTGVIQMLGTADIVAVAGEASSHCVRETVNQVLRNIGPDHVKKFHLLTNCMSPVPAVPGVDFPAIAAAWMKDVEKMGVTLTDSTRFLA